MNMSFLVYGVTNLCYGLGTSMTFSLYGNTEKKNIHKLREDLNNHQSNIKFTYNSSETCLPFLDLGVCLSEGKLSTNLYI